MDVKAHCEAKLDTSSLARPRRHQAILAGDRLTLTIEDDLALMPDSKLRLILAVGGVDPPAVGTLGLLRLDGKATGDETPTDESSQPTVGQDGAGRGVLQDQG